MTIIDGGMKMNGMGDLTTKIENLLMDNLPHVKELITEKVGSAARGAVDNEEICRTAAIKIFKFMPRQIRMTISEMEFADLFWKNRHVIFSKERFEEIRRSAAEPENGEDEIIQKIYKKVEEQRVSLDEILKDLKILENKTKKKS
jgi:hypothetical protein